MTETDLNWDQFRGGGDFVSFKEIGDSFVGTVLAVRIGQDFNGNPAPELLLRDDEGNDKTLTAGQTVLKSELAEARPKVGDRIAITYSGVGDAKPGRAPAKLFQVAVKPGTGTAETVTESTKAQAPAGVGAADLL